MVTKKVPTKTVAPNEGEPRHLVYAGRRTIQGGVGYAYFFYDEKTQDIYEDELVYSAKPDRMRVIGWVYTGARFIINGDERTSIGLAVAKANSELEYRDDAKVKEWEALDHRCEADYKMEKLRADKVRMGTLERSLEPLRRMHAELRSRGDISGCRALRDTVLDYITR